jgi:hypothetical protein
VQHTGEIAPGVQIDEVWAFGEPRQGLEWPGLVMDTHLAKLPPDAKVRRWGAP